MTARHRAFAPALAAALATLVPQPAPALERTCTAPTVEADPEVITRFPELFERVRAELGRPDVDTCARVALRAEGPAIVHVSVTLPDGRVATRSAERAEDVVPILQALLLLPAALPVLEAPTPPKPVPGVLSSVVQGPASRLPAQRDRALPSSVEPTARALGFELSLVGGPRMGEDQLAVGLGALSFIEVHGWLFGFQSRVDRHQTVLSDPEMGLELALLAGKRLHFRSFALDLNAGPALAMKGLAFSSSETVRVNQNAPPPGSSPAPPSPFPEDPGTGPVPRLVFGARAGFTPRDALRSFAGIEASLGPARAEENENPASARFPIFALGLVLGATVGTR
jgi:hypothetical protein